MIRKKSPAQLDREITQALARGTKSAHAAAVRPRHGGTAHATKRDVGVSVERVVDRQLVDAIHPGSRVTIVDRFGTQRTGRAVMRGPYGWVLNMGGAHGTPAIATDDNVVKVSAPRSGRSHATIEGAIPGIAK